MLKTCPQLSRCLSLLLSFAIVYTGAPFQKLQEVRAQSTADIPSTEVTAADQETPGTQLDLFDDEANSLSEEEQRQKDLRLEEIRNKILDPAKSGHAAWDPFLLLDQFVIDERRYGVDAEILKVRMEDYEERLSHHRSRLAEIEGFRQELQAMGRSLSLEDNQRAGEIQLALEDLDSRKAMHEVELEDLAKYDPAKGGDTLDVEHFVDEELPRRSYLGSKLQIQILDASGETVSVISQKEYTESLSPLFDRANPLEGLPSENGPYSFAIHHPKGERLHRFQTPIASIGFFGHFLVFEDARVGADKPSRPLRFIDLNTFRFSVGNSALPVFSLPLKDADLSAPMKISEGKLYVGGQNIQFGQIVVLSQIFQAIYNVNVALVDPATYKNAKLLVGELYEFLGTSMDAQGKLAREQFEQAFEAEAAVQRASQILGDSEAPMDGALEDLKSLVQKVQESGELNSEEMAKLQAGLHLRAGLQESNEAVGEGRRFFNRFKLFVSSAFLPRPQGAPKLNPRNTLLALSSLSEKSAQMRAGLARNPYLKYAKYGAGAVGVVVGAHNLPEGYGLHMSESVGVLSGIWAHFQGYLAHIDFGRAYADLSKDAFVTSVSGISYVWPSYFSEGKWAAFAVGIAKVLWVPTKVFLAFHLIVNTTKAVLDTRKIPKRIGEKRVGLLKRFVKSAATQHEDYWQRAEDAEREESGSDVRDLTDKDVDLMFEFKDRLTSGQESAKALGRQVKNLKKTHKFRASVQRTLETVTAGQQFQSSALSGLAKLKGFMKAKKISAPETVFQALRSSFASYYSLSATFKVTNSIWNWLFIARLSAFSPSKWLMFLIYPNYFRVAAPSTTSAQQFPSDYNSGLESWGAKVRRILSKAQIAAFDSKAPLGSFRGHTFFMSRRGLAGLRAFENAVLPIETVAMKFAFRQAQLALIQRMESPEAVLSLFNSASDPTLKMPGASIMQTTTGIRSLHDKKIAKLSHANRIYFRAFYTRAFDTFMQEALLDVTKNVKSSPYLHPRDFAEALIKEVKDSNGIVRIKKLKSEEMEAMETKIEAAMDFNAIDAYAKSMTEGFRKLLARFSSNNFRHKLLQSIHPGQNSIRRYLISKEKMNDQRAMDRAVRMEISNMLTTIPIGILTTLVMFAAVQTGMLQPFDMFGLNTDTHFERMSRYHFFNGFIPGLILGILANTWMKLQTDSRQADMGSFSRVPLQRDAEKSFARFFLKNLTKNPTNKWKDNQLFYMKLIVANMPAALVTITVFNLYGLGRFDVGSYLAGYLLMFTAATTGFGLKIDQAFELASSWVRAQFPRKWRAHRDIQKKIFGSIQKKKNLFAIWSNFFQIIVLDNLIGDMVTMKDNVKHGTRAFLRLVFGGELPTTLLDRFLAAVQTVPGGDRVGGWLRHFFTNNFEAWERFPERVVGDATEGAERIKELTENLPTNPVAAGIGKTLGITATVGGFAAAPYAIDSALRNRREAKRTRENADFVASETEIAATVREILDAKKPVAPAPALHLEDRVLEEVKPDVNGPQKCRFSARKSS